MVSRDRKRCFLYFMVRRGKEREEEGPAVWWVCTFHSRKWTEFWWKGIHFLYEAKGVEARLKREYGEGTEA